MYLWTYWDKEETRTPYINMCLELMAVNSGSFEFILLTDENIREYLPGAIDYKKIRNKKKLDDPEYIHTCHGSDYLKVAILEKYGGLYVDADCILMKGFKNLINDINWQAYDYIGREQENGYITVNFMWSKRGGKVISTLHNKQMEMLIKSYELKSGSAFAARPLTEIVKQVFNEAEVRVIPERKIAPLGFNKYKMFFWGMKLINSMLEQQIKDAYCVILYNRAFSEYFKEMKKYDILNNDYFISYIFREAYGYNE